MVEHCGNGRKCSVRAVSLGHLVVVVYPQSQWRCVGSHKPTSSAWEEESLANRSLAVTSAPLYPWLNHLTAVATLEMGLVDRNHQQ